MKKYLISTVAVLMVLLMAWAAFGQQERRGGGRTAEGREGRQNLSEEERAKMRERFQNMSEEERDKFRAEMRERFAAGRGGSMGRVDQQAVIKVIEAQLAKLKAAQTTLPTGGFRDLSEEERTKLRERMTKVFQGRQNALQTIIAQVALLQGRRGPAPEGARYLIISTVDLKPIQDSAVKEKAKETAKLLQGLIRGSGRRGGFGGGRPTGGTRPGGTRSGGTRPGGTRGTRTPRDAARPEK